MKSTFDGLVKMQWEKVWAAVKPNEWQSFSCDDAEGNLNIVIDPMGDVHMHLLPGRQMTGGFPTIRARTWGGGGRSERVRCALILLALAIKEDRKEVSRE